MPKLAGRPLLFLDVDGPLIPLGPAALRRPDSTAQPARPGTNPLLTRLDPELGRRLSRLPCELVWATTWMADANEVVAPLIGLPELQVVAWPDEDEEDDRLHWKTRTLVAWAAGAHSSGSTTKSPTRIGAGCPHTTPGKRSFIASTPAAASPPRTSPPSTTG